MCVTTVSGLNFFPFLLNNLADHFKCIDSFHKHICICINKMHLFFVKSIFNIIYDNQKNIILHNVISYESRRSFKGSTDVVCFMQPRCDSEDGS